MWVSKQKLLEPVSIVSCVMLPRKKHDKEQEMPFFDFGGLLRQTRGFWPPRSG